MTYTKETRHKVLSLVILALALCQQRSYAQIGDYRDDFAIGVNAGYMMTSVGFSPKVTQSMKPGVSGGLSFRYTSEKYFKTLCSVYAEFNYAQMGWKEYIVNLKSEPVTGTSGEAEKYDRRINYIQLPVMAQLSWGGEHRGFGFVFQAGPQFGYMLSESTATNFTVDNANTTDRANKTVQQYSMPVEKKLDYGICAGLGLQYSHPSVGHFLLDARYYYGLGNIYGSTKRDYFGKSNHAAIEVKLAYMIDLKKHGRKGNINKQQQ